MMMAAVLVVTVIGLKVVGLVLIVALLIIPPVAARFWTEQVGRMIWIAGLIGGGFGICRRGDLGLGAEPADRSDHRARGGGHLSGVAAVRAGARLAAAVLRQRHFKARVHQRQGLLALARQEPIRESLHPAAAATRGPDPRRWRADGCRPRGGGQGLRDERRWEWRARSIRMPA
jgi:manganese/zinc/iron transport system permease protein